MTEQEQLNYMIKIYREEMRKPSNCMCPSCNGQTIKNSHVLQEARILKPFAPKGHMYLMQPQNLHAENRGVKFKREGINKVLSFQGFCSTHDNDLFELIEKPLYVDWSATETQYLLAYKTLCREVDIKSRTFNYFEKLGVQKNENPVWGGLEVAKFNKTLIEMGIFHNDYSHYQFQTIELDFLIELFVAAPITVVEDATKLISVRQVEANIVIVFPYADKTIVIIGCREEFENRWMHAFLNQLSATKQSALKALNDLILYRTEFTAMSESLYDSIDKNELGRFILEYNENGQNFGCQLSSDINIFQNL